MNSEDMADGIRGRLSPAATQTARESEAVPLPPHIADYAMLRRIGGGSYGDVWLARSATGQLRAVKVVWRQNFSSERPYEREFHGIVQFEPISRSHPGVVNVLHVGRDDAAGCFFYVMELADAAASERGSGVMESGSDGKMPAAQHSSTPPLQHPGSYSPRTLAADLKSRGHLPVSEVLRLGVQLADALGHLHRHGLVHRDVKPSNVIFVSGHLKLADIGLVTTVQEARSFVGTEGFIPPEGPGTEKADLFALGRLLYEAVTGKDRCEFPDLPGDLERWPAPEREALLELNEVLAKLCAPDLADRHANAAEVAGDLNLILAGRSVRRAYGIERRLRRATQVSAAALAVVALAAGVIGFQRFRQRQVEVRAAQERVMRERAEAAERGMEQQLYAALLEQARATVLSGELGQRVRALDAVRRAGAISNSAALRGVAVAALSLPDLRFQREWPTTPDMTLVQLDPAFRRIALCRRGGPVEIRSLADQRLLVTLPASTNRPAFVGLWSSDGRYFAVSRDHDPTGLAQDVEVWEVAAPRRILVLGDSRWGAMSFHPRLPRIIIGQAPATAVTWDLETGENLTRHQLAGGAVALEFSPGGERVAASQETNEQCIVGILRTTDGVPEVSQVFSNHVHALNWHPSGRWIAVPDHGGAVHRMEARTGETLLLGRHKAEAVIAEFSPDGQYLFSGGWDRELICWDAKALRRAFTVGLDSYRIQFRADGRQCAIMRWPEVRLQLHTLERPSHHREFAEDLGGGPSYAAFSSDGRWLAACGNQRLVVWDLTSDGPGAVFNEAWNMRPSFAPNSELFANRPGECFRWRVTPGTNATAPPNLERLELAKPERFVSLCLMSNGVALTSARGSKLAAFDRLGIDQGSWTPTADGLNGVSPDGRWLGMFRSFTPYFYAYRLPGFERVAKLTNEARIARFEFSPLGNELAVCSRGGVEFWSTTTWQRTRHLTNFTDILYSLDAQTFWLSTEFRTAGLHDARAAELLLPLPPGTLPVAVSPDGRHLAVSVDARRVQVWDLVEVRERLRELGLDWPSH